MGLHGMRLTVRDELSIPTEQDKIKDCAPHGGAEKIRLAARSSNQIDDYRFLRIRHGIEDNGIGAGAAPTASMNFGASNSNSAGQSMNLGASNSNSAGQSYSDLHGSAKDDSVRRLTPSLYETFQKAPDIENQLRELSEYRFDPRYIEIEAGEHDDFLREVADDMLPGRQYHNLIQRFLSRGKRYPKAKPEMQVQRSFVHLANGLARVFYDHRAGEYEDDMGEKHECKKGDVFASRGSTYIKQVETEQRQDGPKLELDEPESTIVPDETKRHARWVAQNKPDITNETYQGKVLKPAEGILWSQTTFAAEVRARKSEDSKGPIVHRSQRYQVSAANWD